MEVREFVAACRQLSALDFSPAAVELADRGVRENMTLRYAMPYPADVHQTFDVGPRASRNRRGQWHELVQHLTDLAYLTPEHFRQWHAARAAGELPAAGLLTRVVSAAGRFVAEDEPAPYRLMDAFPTTDLRARLDWVERYLSVLVYRTAAHTSFDGELAVRPDYRVGERTAYGRSLAFRIRVYFHDYLRRRSAQRKVYFDAELLPFLHSLDNSLRGLLAGQLPEAGAVRLHVTVHLLLLDARRLFTAFRETHRLMDRGAGRYYLVYDLDGEAEEAPGGREQRLQRRAGRKLKRDEIHVDTGHNRLGVRLLQLGLWRAGFYTGVLDGAFGPLSHAALLGLLTQEAEAEDPVLPARQLDRVLVRGEGSSTYLVDLKRFGRLLDAYAPPPEAEAEREEAVLWDRVAAAGGEERLEDLFTERNSGLGEAYGEQQLHPNRRVYYGLRGLIRGAFRAVGRVVRWIAGVVESVLGAVFDFVKSVIKRIQEGIGLFFTGFRYLGHYLLGRPLVSLGAAVGDVHPVLLTRFSLDFDAVSLADAGATAEDVRRHTDHLRRMGQSVEYFLEIGAATVRLIAALTSPGGWLRLGLAIARWVREWLHRRDAGVRPVA